MEEEMKHITNDDFQIFNHDIYLELNDVNERQIVTAYTFISENKGFLRNLTFWVDDVEVKHTFNFMDFEVVISHDKIEINPVIEVTLEDE